jgi:hypothetical protein
MALTGADLLAKVKELGEISKSDLVRAAGYVSGKKDGGERLNFTAFYEALLEAKGVSLGRAGGSTKGRAGRSLGYITKIQFNGNLLVGKAYTAMLDLKPGDEFEIKLGRKQIRLVPLGETEEEEAPANVAAKVVTKPAATAKKPPVTAKKPAAAKKPVAATTKKAPVRRKTTK